MAIIQQLMKTELVTCKPDERVSDVARKLRDNAVGAVLVVEGDELAGLFSERDLVRRVVAAGQNPAQVYVGDVATRRLTSVAKDTPIKRCVELLQNEKFRHLPVLDDGKPIGILSARDLFAYVSAELERMVDDAKYRELVAAGEDPYDHIGGSYGR